MQQPVPGPPGERTAHVERLESLALAEAFLDAYREAHPDDAVQEWGSLPEFGPAAAAAKMAVFAGAAPEGEQGRAWDAVQRAFARFAAADAYLFSVPMWNAGVPYVLKQFIDVVSQPGTVFGFDPATGYTGLVTGRKAAVVYTSAVYGPSYRPGFGRDFQQPFVDDWLDWAGITTTPRSRSARTWSPLTPRPPVARPTPPPATSARGSDGAPAGTRPGVHRRWVRPTAPPRGGSP